MASNKPQIDHNELKFAAEAADKAYENPSKARLDGFTSPKPHVDPEIGFVAYEQNKIGNPSEITINIRGTEFDRGYKEATKDVVADIGLLQAWMDSPVFARVVDRMATEIQKGSHVKAIGHSAGGGLAEALCYQALEKAGRNAPGRCTVENIQGPGSKEALESVLDRPLDPSVMSRIEGYAHRISNEQVSKFGTSLVETATYPRATTWTPGDPDLGPLLGAPIVSGKEPVETHLMKSFFDDVINKKVQPISIRHEKASKPFWTQVGRALGGTSALALTSDGLKVDRANIAVQRAFAKLSRTPRKLDQKHWTKAKDYALSEITLGKSIEEIAAKIVQEFSTGNAENLKSALRSGTGISMLDPYSAPVADLIGTYLHMMGYDPIDPKVSQQAYVDGIGAGLWHEDALDVTAARAIEVAEANAIKTPMGSPLVTIDFDGQPVEVRGRAIQTPEFEAAYTAARDSGMTDEAATNFAAAKVSQALDASKNSPVGKYKEQKTNTVPGKQSNLFDTFADPITSITGIGWQGGPGYPNRSAKIGLGVPGANPQKGRQLASLGGKEVLAGFMNNPTVFDAQMEKQGEARNRARDIDAATKTRTNKAERQAAMARDRQELARAAEIDERRNKLADDRKISVAAFGVEDFGAEGFVPNTLAKAGKRDLDSREIPRQMAEAVRTAQNSAKSKGEWNLRSNQDSRRNRPTDGDGGSGAGGRDGRGGDYGAEGFVPGAPHEPLSLQPVTNADGKPIRSDYSGFVVTTGGGRENLLIGGPSDNGPDTRVICTELVRQGRLEAELYFLDLRFAEERLSPAHLRGYHLWAVPLVRLMRRSRLATAIVAPLARWRAEEVAHVLGKRPRGSLRGKIVRFVGEPLCWLLGRFARETDYSMLYEQETSS